MTRQPGAEALREIEIEGENGNLVQQKEKSCNQPGLKFRYDGISRSPESGSTESIDFSTFIRTSLEFGRSALLNLRPPEPS
ncbi:hypothetical protein TNCV_3685131 [Trichonephila clavipes]|uniref:Uncharacterized protein n=1 Tax=Trichonephila clavipes TaxID=2585209 RepID=A0A8X6UWI7_TRICX|nr:hypothetical protein TNCV_3685131 [Trichonephila clavipes]